jgi:tetrahydromethanopterin S-methyltransferase subunit F|tara:strand:+ start:640 stop:1779 length:1140 start_codon:yes stop_codon:yes gene_type:complete
MHTREKVVGVAIGWLLWGAVASACPFCDVVGRSLSERRDQSAVVAIGETNGTAVLRNDSVLYQPWQIMKVIRGTFQQTSDIISARVEKTEEGTGIVFGDSVGIEGLQWSAFVADELVMSYLVAAPPLNMPDTERLQWFVSRLEHPSTIIAEDAFMEFGLASFEAVESVAGSFNAGKLKLWVTELGIDERRRGFYGLALGLVAAQTPDQIERASAIEILHEAIEKPSNDFRAGFDGIMGGVLVAEGESGLDYLIALGFSKPSARPVDQRHFLTALRFAWESLFDAIPREQIIDTTATMIHSPVVSKAAIIDLARWQAWSYARDVASLWDSLGDEDPLIRRAVAGYLIACPKSISQSFLEDIRSRDPERLELAIEASRLPI